MIVKFWFILQVNARTVQNIEKTRFYINYCFRLKIKIQESPLMHVRWRCWNCVYASENVGCSLLLFICCLILDIWMRINPIQLNCCAAMRLFIIIIVTINEQITFGCLAASENLFAKEGTLLILLRAGMYNKINLFNHLKSWFRQV